MQIKTELFAAIVWAFVMLAGMSGCAGNRSNIQTAMEKMAADHNRRSRRPSAGHQMSLTDLCGRRAVL